MKLQIDVKSAIAGAVAAAVIVAVFSFRDAGKAPLDAGERYQTKVNGSGVIILDTYTGKFIITPEIRNFGKVQWIKGEFDDTYATGLDNKKVAGPEGGK